MPQRIQLRRTKGWRKPPGVIVVSRPSRWGNPFKADVFGLDLAIALFRDAVRGCWLARPMTDAQREEAYRLTGEFRKRHSFRPWEEVRELRGRDLACWCPLPKPGEPDVCHARVLIELANEKE